jgi:hypothetical protein
MRPLAVLTLLLVLLVAAPAAAQDGLDMTSQTEGYGRLFAYVCSAVAALTVILVTTHVIRGMKEEVSRGKKKDPHIEKILDEIPKRRREAYLGEKVPDWKIGPRQEATTAALKYLARTDPGFKLKGLAELAEEAFRSVKAAIEARTAKAVDELMLDDAYAEIQTEVKRLKKKGQKRIFGDPEVSEVQVIHIEAAGPPDKHTFTALISAKSRDYHAHEKSGKVLRGAKTTYIYQEFYRFRRSRGKWRVEEIRPSGDMDVVVNRKNVLAQHDLDEFLKTADPEYAREFTPPPKSKKA